MKRTSQFVCVFLVEKRCRRSRKRLLALASIHEKSTQKRRKILRDRFHGPKIYWASEKKVLWARIGNRKFLRVVHLKSERTSRGHSMRPEQLAWGSAKYLKKRRSSRSKKKRKNRNPHNSTMGNVARTLKANPCNGDHRPESWESTIRFDSIRQIRSVVKIFGIFENVATAKAKILPNPKARRIRRREPEFATSIKYFWRYHHINAGGIARREAQNPENDRSGSFFFLWRQQIGL